MNNHPLETLIPNPNDTSKESLEQAMTNAQKAIEDRQRVAKAALANRRDVSDADRKPPPIARKDARPGNLYWLGLWVDNIHLARHESAPDAPPKLRKPGKLELPWLAWVTHNITEIREGKEINVQRVVMRIQAKDPEHAMNLVNWLWPLGNVRKRFCDPKPPGWGPHTTHLYSTEPDGDRYPHPPEAA
jgi:hypothetical protein